MPGDDLNIKLRLTADGKGFVGEVRVARAELDKLTGSAGKSRAAADGQAQAFRKTMRAAQEHARALRRGEVATKGFTQSLASAHGRIIGYVGGIAGITVATRGLVRHADSVWYRLEWEMGGSGGIWGELVMVRGVQTGHILYKCAGTSFTYSVDEPAQPGKSIRPWKEQTTMSRKLEFMVCLADWEGSFALLCEICHISRVTGYKWRRLASQLFGASCPKPFGLRENPLPVDFSVKEDGRRTPGMANYARPEVRKRRWTPAFAGVAASGRAMGAVVLGGGGDE